MLSTACAHSARRIAAQMAPALAAVAAFSARRRRGSAKPLLALLAAALLLAARADANSDRMRARGAQQGTARAAACCDMPS